MDDLGLVEAVDRLGQRVVVAVADTAHRRFDAGFGEALGVADADILRSAVGMMNQTAAMNGPAFVQGLFESVEHKARVGGPAHPPADDTARIGVDDEGHVDEARPGAEWSKKRRCASPPRTVLAPFSAYGSPFKLGPWPLQHHDSST